MKKNRLITLITLALSMSLTGCGGATGGNSLDPSSNISASSSIKNEKWSDEEKAIIKEHIYDIDLPYVEVEGSSKLAYDEDYNQLYKIGGTSSANLLAEYAKLFIEAGWTDYGSTAGTDDAKEDGYYYTFIIEVKTNEGTRYVEADFCGIIEVDGYEDWSKDGSGKFYLVVGDPYYYSWPKDVVDYLLLDVLATSETVPAFNDAIYYQVNSTFIDLAALVIYAYTDNAYAQSDYAKILTSNGYVYSGTTSDNYAIYFSSKGDIEIDIWYDGSYKDLDIIIHDGDGEIHTPGGEIVDPGEENPLGGVDVLTQENLGLTKGVSQYKEVSFTSSKTGATYTGAASAAEDIQLRSKNGDSGIVSVKSGGTLVSISVSWSDSMASKASQSSAANSACALDIYASNTPFTLDDMYNGSLVAIGTINYRNDESSYTFTSEYKYLGLRSQNGAVNMQSISISWKA